MSCILNDGGDDAEAQGRRVDHQEVVLGLHFCHDLGLAVTLPLTQNVGTMTRRCLVRILSLLRHFKSYKFTNTTCDERKSDLVQFLFVNSPLGPL